MEAVGREPAEKTILGVDSTTVLLTVYRTVYDSLFLKYRIQVTVHKPHKDRLSLAPQSGANGFRGRTPSSLQCDLAQRH
jgi:hypothetical protein